MVTEQRWKTQPLQCLDKAREIRAGYYKELWQAKESGKLIGMTSGSRSNLLIGSLADCMPAEMTAFGLPFNTNRETALKCIEAHEAAGYLWDYCGFHRVQLGAAILNIGPWGTEALKADFFLPVSYCEPLAKALQAQAEYWKVPYFPLDLPCISSFDEQQRKDFEEYFISQMQDAIEWMQKITGKPYQDEKLIEGIRNEWLSTSYMTKIALLNRAIPAPLTETMYYSLFSLVNFVRHRKETVEFFRMAYDEISHHVENQIGALATERCRILHEGVHILFAPHLYQVPKKYGAVFIPGPFVMGLGSNFERRPDGSWHERELPEKRGMPLRTREDALRWLADWYLNNIHFQSQGLDVRLKDMVFVAEQWHANGVAFHFDHGCVGLSAAMPEQKLALLKKGIPSFYYEGDAYDPRRVSEVEVTRSMESFLESLGLKPIKD